MKRFCVLGFFSFLAMPAFSQFIGKVQMEDDSAQTTQNFEQIEQVIVNGLVTEAKATSLNVSMINTKSSLFSGAYNLTDALSRIPGVSQLTTGIAISKPVIRGLYGNRIMVLLSGIRFDNQQWQDEHGLGLSQLGIDRIELLKGATSLIYGTEAIGGTINIIEETPAFELNGTKRDAGISYYSNTAGALCDYGIQRRLHSEKRNISKWQTLRIGIENHADYSDGNSNRVLNTRNQGLLMKLGWGKSSAKFSQENRYMFSYNQYGFVMDGLNDFFKPDARYSRSLNGPHHNVMLNTFSSQNRFYVNNTKVNLNVGLQSNSRMEDEGGGQISLNMHLFSLLQNMQFTFPQYKYGANTVSYFLNQQLSFSSNKNYGGRVIVPDAHMAEANVGGLVKFTRAHLVLDGGLGVAFKGFQTYQTRTLNSPGEKIQPFAKNAVASNASLGFALIPVNLYLFRIGVKGNVGTGFRPGNLAELSCNGLHEGSIRYELGNPNLKNETNVTSDFTLDMFSYKILDVKFSSYYNQFNNYIYLAPTKDSFYGYQVFKYEQTNAKILGTETSVVLHMIKNFDWVNIWTQIAGTKTTGASTYLPFMSPKKYTSRFVYIYSKKDRLFTIAPEVVFVGDQMNTAEFETTTQAYKLYNIQIDYQIFNQWNFSLSMRNITNTVYYDHLSRLKAYNLYNQGRNFVFSFRKTF